MANVIDKHRVTHKIVNDEEPYYSGITYCDIIFHVKFKIYATSKRMAYIKKDTDCMACLAAEAMVYASEDCEK